MLGSSTLKNKIPEVYHVVSFKTVSRMPAFDDYQKVIIIKSIRRLQRFCAIDVLTYCVTDTDVEMLVSVPDRESYLTRFEGKNEEGKLIDHFKHRYSASRIAEIKEQIAEARASGEDGQDVFDHYTRRICDLNLFVEAIQQGFTHWYKNKFSKDSSRVRGQIWAARLAKDEMVKGAELRQQAVQTDLAAIRKGLVTASQNYRWSGYAKACTGDKNAQRGLCRVMGASLHDWDEVRAKYGDLMKVKAGEIEKVESPAKNVDRGNGKLLISPSHKNKLGTRKWVKWSMVVLLLGAVAYGVKFYTAPKKKDGQPVEKSDETSNTPSSRSSHEEPAFDNDPNVVANAFLAATDPSERLKMARNWRDVKAHMTSYHAEALNGKTIGLGPVKIGNVGGITCSSYEVVLASGDMRQLTVVPTEDGMKVDWDAYARYGTATWSQILAGTVKSADVRVRVKPVGHYIFAFRDDTRWRCYLLSSPDVNQSVYAYAKVGSTTHEILKSAATQFDGPGARLTIRISSTKEGLKHRQFNLDRVLAIGWVLNKPEKFENTWVKPHADILNGEGEKLHAPRSSFK
ncbi:MAG: hypothetical protein H7A51_19520 [Akkermansiaceae bacterium]|nr:hypothetical protein [Akkermansiaceae bacterium]